MVQTSESTRTLGSRQWVDRYLAFLGVPAEPPSLPALARLTRAHLYAVAFENITSLLRRRTHGLPVPPVDPESMLAAWEQGLSGGVCFEAGYMYSHLLPALGYDAHLVLNCKGRFDGGHQAVHVTLGGRRYLVDVGNGSPHFDPIPLDGVVEVHHAGLAYRFRPGDEPEEWIQDRWIDESWTPFFTYNLRPADDEVRKAAYQRHHVPGESFVVSSLTLIRCEDDQVLQLRNDEFIRHTDAGKQRQILTTADDYIRVAAEEFRMPNLPIAEGVAAWLDLARDLPEPWAIPLRR